MSRVQYTHLDTLSYPGRRALPSFTDLGGYTLIYVDQCGDILCSDCATDALVDPDNDSRLECAPYYEGPTEICNGCSAEMDASYGDPWAEEKEGES